MHQALERAFDPEGFRVAGHALVDQLADYLARASRGEIQVVDLESPEARLASWPPTFPDGAAGDDALTPFFARVLDEAIHLHHPRYVGHQVTAPVPLAALAELCAALLNNSMAVYEMGPGATAMERAATRWMSDRLGLGASASGVLTSGGSIGNLTALLAARQAKGGVEADADPWRDGTGRDLAILCSSDAHYSVARAAQIMGLGEAGAIQIPIDAEHRLRVDALADGLDRAKRSGRRVFAIAASACSTSTGAFDPLEPIADFCDAHGLWLHVDGAHGASAVLSDKYRHLVRGIERADSVIWDAHKMMLMPGLVTAVLFKDGARSYDAFAQRATYLFDPGHDGDRERPLGRAAFDTGLRTLECTKRMMSLKLVAALSLLGARFFDAYVTEMFDLAARFGDRLAREPDFELALRPACNIVCFRHLPADGRDLDEHQARVRAAVVASGRFFLVQTKLSRGVFLRTTLINPRTSDADLEALLHAIREAAAAPR